MQLVVDSAPMTRYDKYQTSLVFIASSLGSRNVRIFAPGYLGIDGFDLGHGILQTVGTDEAFLAKFSSPRGPETSVLVDVNNEALTSKKHHYSIITS